MKKLLVSGSIVSLLLPWLAFAAYNDVSLTTDTVLSVNGITLNVSGSTAVIESIVVDSTTFTVTLQGNAASTFQVTAPNLNELATNSQNGLSTHICNATQSKLGYTASSSEVIVIITPSATLCTTAAADTSGGSGSSGGGGGGATTVITPVAPVVPVAQLTTSEAIAAIKAQLIPLIQQLIVLLNLEIQKMQASGSY
ncbi:MAG: hypothetical protein Q7K26_02590 [bacterium]|nr:hypothetical protein [bacterium]